MTPTRLSSVLADDLLLDRVGARLDCDDELGSLLLSVARQVDAPISHPGLRPRRRRGHRGLVVLAALGVAVSGATVAAALETSQGQSAALGAPAHTRLLPQALQALGLPFTGPGLASGRILLPGSPGLAGGLGMPGVAVASGPPSATGLPSLILAGPAAGTVVPGAASEGSTADGAASAPPAGSASTVSGSAKASSSKAKGTPTSGGGPDAQGDAASASSKPSDTSTSATSSPTTAPSSTSTPRGHAFAGTGNAGQGALHAATPASKPTPTPTPTSTTPASTRPASPAPANGNAYGAGHRNGGATTKARQAHPATSGAMTPATSPTAVPVVTPAATSTTTSAGTPTPSGT